MRLASSFFLLMSFIVTCGEEVLGYKRTLRFWHLMNEWIWPIENFYYYDNFLFSTVSGEGKMQPSNHNLDCTSRGIAEIKLSVLFSKWSCNCSKKTYLGSKAWDCNFRGCSSATDFPYPNSSSLKKMNQA